MIVIYDISILVDGYRRGAARTGIVRVIEYVAKELINRNDIDIRFCTIENVFNIRDAIDFVGSRPEFKNIPFVYASKYSPLLRALCFSSKFHSLLGHYGKKPLVERIFKYIEFKSISFVEKYIMPKGNDEMSKLLSGSIFHSPFLPFSKHNPNVKKAIKFITIYDLIPVLYPEFFSEETIDMLRQAYDGIDKDTYVLCISETTRKDLLNYKGDTIDPNKVFVTHLAASDHFRRSDDRQHNLAVLKKYNIPSRPYILGLSILDPRKNMVQIIDAFAELVKQRDISDLDLVLVGPKGYGADKISKAIQDHPILKGRIILTGFVADQDLAAVYSEALMFVYPSFYEGFGLPILEAMQCGVPVITSNNSSMPEVAGEAAIFIDPLDRSQLKNGMYELYSDPGLRNQLAGLGMERSRLFSWKQCAEQTATAYKLACQTTY